MRCEIASQRAGRHGRSRAFAQPVRSGSDARRLCAAAAAHGVAQSTMGEYTGLLLLGSESTQLVRWRAAAFAARTVVALAQMRLVSSVGRADASGLGLRQGGK